MKNNILSLLSQSEDIAISWYFQEFLWEFHSDTIVHRRVLFRYTARNASTELIRTLSKDAANIIVYDALWNIHDSRMIHNLSEKICLYLIQYQREHVWKIQRAVNRIIFW